MIDKKQVSDDLYSLLPLRDIVVFPGMIAPLFVGRSKSISALEDVLKKNKMILLVTQKDASKDEPAAEDIYKVGVLANILQLLKLPDGTVKVLVEGRQRMNIKEVIEGENFFQARVSVIDEKYSEDKDIKALSRSILNQFAKYSKLNKKVAPEVTNSLSQVTDAARLADAIASHLTLEIDEKQKILECIELSKRIEMIYSYMESEMEVLDTEKKIRTRIKDQMEKTQKEYYLNEQLKAIHKELGEEDGKDEISRLEEQVKKLKLTKEAKDKALSEIKKLKAMSPMSAESTVTRNYLDWLFNIPWDKRSRIKGDLKFANDVLDKDHYALDKVKERILEFLAVQQRTKKVGGTVICLVGPPGVGKTSLAKSIAKAIGRKFGKISLGGVRDESEIRGHRRTYIGSMPGKIIQSMKKVGASNPLLLLDEIDKMGNDFRGDPASALLEVLDPEQNSNFNDHYLEVDYDLSDVMFVTTANSLNMPPPLLDRLEVIRIAGYTEDEKIEIAKRHLISKQTKKNGLKKGEWSVSDDALRDIIRYYTREAGVRNLEREISKLARKSVKEILTQKTEKVEISSKNIEKYLGVKKFSFGETGEKDLVGVVTGLAYTEFGGDMLTIEAVKLPGRGVIKSTGKLGEVMQESTQAAFSYARSRCLEHGITPPQYRKEDIHIHVPEGATPKDGPSAGVAIYTAIVSVMTGIPVKKSVAMTGEITLRGRVFPIGGLKEKLLAALRGGVKTVLIPKENEKDLAEIPDNVKNGLELIPITTAEEALNIALTKIPEPTEWVEVENIAADATVNDGDDSFITH
ncbi:MAG: endopeptidase La [Rickettsiales bacterium]|nr:endopeptidase La [Pseudomonadota bacterium]MDA0966325.1 endopeptidase La [Pseudomonadota bacterium]MDG4543957.1 endopeptidase La [Rickettsiales bacterium]MDG4545451.1 endopeptidase La [Rickettsiales bacterium]MDG4547900.1 endopeptidase La [Rickettsiales bacterium]